MIGPRRVLDVLAYRRRERAAPALRVLEAFERRAEQVIEARERMVDDYRSAGQAVGRRRVGR